MLANPESIYYWQELGLGPVGGSKDVNYLTVHFGEGDPEVTQLIARAYQVCLKQRL